MDFTYLNSVLLNILGSFLLENTILKSLIAFGMLLKEIKVYKLTIYPEKQFIKPLLRLTNKLLDKAVDKADEAVDVVKDKV